MCAKRSTCQLCRIFRTLRGDAVADDREFRVRPGRIRSTRAQAARPFIAQALAAAKKAGGGVSRSGRVTSGNRSRFGHGQRASIQANRLITARSRGAGLRAMAWPGVGLHQAYMIYIARAVLLFWLTI